MKLERRAFVVALAGQALFRGTRADDRAALLAAAWERGGVYSREVAERLPADRWGFRPVPEVRSFHEQVVHLATATLGFADLILGAAPAPRLPSAPTVDEALALLSMASTRGLAAMRALPVRGDQRVPWSRRLWTGETVSLWSVAETMRDHATHHRAQMVLYLRLQGIVPPAYVD